MTKENGYEANPSQKGCQFERLMTGKRDTDTATYSHMQVLQLNGKNVLFIADTDGVDSQKKAVEIKLSSSRKSDSSFIKSAILQMISNGSNTLVYGSTNKDDTMVTSVEKKYLSNLIEDHTTNLERTLLTTKIKKTLAQLPWHIREKHTVYEVNFETTNSTKIVNAVETYNVQVLPPTSVVLCYLHNITPNILAQDAYRLITYSNYNKHYHKCLSPKTLWTDVFTKKAICATELPAEMDTQFNT